MAIQTPKMEATFVAVDEIADILYKNQAVFENIDQLRTCLGISTATWEKHDKNFKSGAITAHKYIANLLAEWIQLGVYVISDLCDALEIVDCRRIAGELRHKFGIDRKVVAQAELSDALNLSELTLNKNPGTGNHKGEKPRIFTKKFVSQEMNQHIESLPIFQHKTEIMKAISNNQIVIIVGETGSGKSTQLPVYLAEAGFGKSRMIACTQPRRLACKSLAERVSAECGSEEVGSLVGYAVRFDRNISSKTVIKYMTDGLLVREFALKQNLKNYAALIIDEVHERSKYTDVILALLKVAVSKQSDLKVILTSATMDAQKFASYYGKVLILNVSGKIHSVTEIYDARIGRMTNYLDHVIDTVCKIHREEGPGDMLVFLPGQSDIETVEERIILRTGLDKLEIVTCFGMLPLEQQKRIFKQTENGGRKVVLATNIAETSITIPGIVYVVDCGLFKQNVYNPETGVNSLLLKQISKDQSVQRKGRAGRTGPGKVYRLYSESTLNEMDTTGIPEIQRTNLESIVLQLLAMEIKSLEWLDNPKTESVRDATVLLQELGAIDKNHEITSMGKLMVQFPLDPPLSKVVISSSYPEFHCSKEVLIIAAFLSVQYQNLWMMEKNNRDEVNKCKRMFNHPEGDLLSFLNIYEAWEASNRSMTWCQKHLINSEYMSEVLNIVQQLEDLMKSLDLPLLSCGSLTQNIQKVMCTGFFRNIAKRMPRDRYAYNLIRRTCRGINDKLYIHPGTSLFTRTPTWILYTDILKTTKPYMRGAIIIDPEWLKDSAPLCYRQFGHLFE